VGAFRKSFYSAVFIAHESLDKANGQNHLCPVATHFQLEETGLQLK
jgi:hypothetical protein